jgi:hypothetical protein
MKISGEVAIALELAETTVRYARSREGEADRWLRVLRRMDRPGDALSELGVEDGPLESAAEALLAYDGGDDAIPEVAARAEQYARARGGHVVGSIDLLFGVLAVYGSDFSKALYRRGVTREELLEQIARQVPQYH